MQAAVVVPPFRDFYATPHRQSALGARVAARVLARHGVTVTFHDFAGRPSGGTLSLPGHLSHLADFILPNETGPVSFFTRYRRFGPPTATCAAETCAGHPAVIFMACFAFCYAAPVIELAEECRKRLPQSRIVVGGAGASVYPSYYLRSLAIDYALAGEAESVLPPFLAFLQGAVETPAHVPNLWYRDADGIRGTQQRQSIDSSVSVAASSWLPGRRRAVIRTSVSRGCPRTCRYCANHLVHGRRLRTAELDAVDEALESFDNTRDTRTREISVVFEDDNLLAAPEYTLKVLDLVRRRFGKPGILFENGIDYLHLNPELIGRLATAGVARFNLSLCSVDAAGVKSQNRPHDLSHYEATLRSLQAIDIPSVTYFICGLASDTRLTVAANLAYLYTRPTLSGISLFYPVPGIAGFENRTVFDSMHPSLCAGSSAWPWNGSLSTETMATAFRLSRYVNLCKKRNKSKLESEVMGRVKSEKKLYTISRRGKRREIIPVPAQDEELVRLFFRRIDGP